LSDIVDIEKRIDEIKDILDKKKQQDKDVANLSNELSDLQQKRSLLIGEEHGTLSYTDTIIEELSGRLDTAQQIIDNMIAETLAKVSHWKYATDDYFNPYPFNAEIHKFKKGRILKNVKENERFKKRTIHSFGFNESEQLIIMQYPNGDDIKFGTTTVLYITNANNRIDGYVANWFPENNRTTGLIAINTFLPLPDNNWIYVAVNSNKKNWSSSHYIYDETNCVKRVVLCTLHAEKPECNFLDFFYDEKGHLDRIMVGDYTHWKKDPK
jgi:hypothetical protein